MMSRENVCHALIGYRPESELNWIHADALSCSAFVDPIEYKHPSFVIQFWNSGKLDPDFDGLRFGTKFYMNEPASLEWINDRNSEYRYAKLFWDQDGMVAVLDCLTMAAKLDESVFRQNYLIFDALTLSIAAMASTPSK